MHPRAIATSLVALGFAFIVVVWMGRASQDPIVETEPAPNTTNIDDGRPKISETGPHPKAVCDEFKHDFGIMKHLDSGSHTFVVKNEGEAPLELKTGETTCQCTLGELGDTIIPPGESTEVELKWTIKNPSSRFEHSAEVFTNDPENEMILLMISGFVGRDVVFRPEGSWNMGSITAISEGQFEGMVVSQTRPEMELTNISVLESDAFGIEVVPMSEEEIKEKDAAGLFLNASGPTAPPPPVVGYYVRLKLEKDIPIGQFEHQIKFKIKVDDKTPEYEELMTLGGTRGGPFSFFALSGSGARWHSERLIFQAGSIQAGKGKKTGLIMLIRGGGEDFKVTELSSDLKWLELETGPLERAGNATRVKLNVVFPPGCPQMARSHQNPAELVVKTTHPEASEIRIKLTFATQ